MPEPIPSKVLDDEHQSKPPVTALETDASQDSLLSSLSQPGEPPVVYFEESVRTAMPVKATVKKVVKTAKRQLSLASMLGTTPTPAKKPKTNGSSVAEPSPSSSVLSPSTSAEANFTITSTTTLNSIPFSMPRFRASLSPVESELLALELETMGLSWMKIMKDEIRKPYFINLKKFLKSEGVLGANVPCPRVFPAAGDIYNWSRMTPLGKVRVVIVGQDPYHDVGQAHGLAFSVKPGVMVPGSLRNIYKEVARSYPDFTPPTHGCLIPWATAGVLMLNTTLTVRAHQAGSHGNKGWDQFVGQVLKTVDRWGGANIGGPGEVKGRGRGVVFMAWGAWAQKVVAGLNLDKNRHLILNSSHPSPLSAHKGFLGCGHFRKANDWLHERYGPDGEVNWCALDPVSPTLQQGPNNGSAAAAAGGV